MVRDEIGAVAAFAGRRRRRGAAQDPRGKILRKTMREIADGKDATVPVTIEDVEVLDALASVLRPGG